MESGNEQNLAAFFLETVLDVAKKEVPQPGYGFIQ